MTPALDLSTWLSKSEAAARLAVSERTLERMDPGKGPECRMRPRPGKRPEPCYNPQDIEALAAAAAPPLAINPPAALVFQPNRNAPTVQIGDDMPPALAAALRIVEALATIAQRARPAPAAASRGPWVTLKAAAAETGISVALLRRLVKAGELPVLRWPPSDHAVKVRTSDIDNLDIVAIVSRLSVRAGEP